MTTLIGIVAGFALLVTPDGNLPGWLAALSSTHPVIEHRQFFAVISPKDEAPLLAALDAAAASTGFRLDPERVGRPTPKTARIFRFFMSDALASLLVMSTSVGDCVLIGIDNYNPEDPSLAERFDAQIRQALARALEKPLSFYSDARCEHVL